MSVKTDIGIALKTSMDGYTTRPRVNLWKGIEAELKRKKKRSFLRIILIGILILFILTISFFMANKNTSSPNDPTKTEINSLNDDNINKKEKTKDSTSNKKNDPKNLDANVHDLTNSVESKLPKPLSFEKNTNTNDSNSESLINNRRPNAFDPKLRNINTQKSKENLLLNPVAFQNPKNETSFQKDRIEKPKSPKQIRLSPLDLQRLGELELKIDSIQIKKMEETTREEEIEIKEFNWSLFPHIALDRYHAFGRNATEQNSLNYGIYLSYYSSKRLLLRAGFKALNLQQSFANDSIQRKVGYSEIPMEARYFITHKSRLKTSFIVGGSYLFLRDATFTDFRNNITRDNRDFYIRNIFTLNAGLGLHYDINKRWRMNLEYIFEYHSTPFTRKQDYSPHNSSLSFGVEYRFHLK
jgi:hypothetical protein